MWYTTERKAKDMRLNVDMRDRGREVRENKYPINANMGKEDVSFWT